MSKVDHEPISTMDALSRTARNPIFLRNASRNLTWWEELGVGYYPVTAGTKPYDAAYWDKYVAMSATDIGIRLNDARSRFVDRHYKGDLIDVGIGSGAFIERRGTRNTYGYDVNPDAIAWLLNHKRFWNVYNGSKLPAISLWDVFEHLPDYDRLLANVQDYVFMSIPIFEGAAHVLRSKHYRKDEHVWYFTAEGLIKTFDEFGFSCVEHHYEEELIGREDIGSFAFKRRA